ncbi:MAG: hypothetical protein U9Q30_00820 [Campylobacterota bacterium]|nr:hypothetical protein [Campylobacterota bacterium]
MRNLILISTTPMVIKIFKLISKKLDINLEVLSEAQIDHKVDIIIVDKNLIDDRFAILKTYSKQIGAITNEVLPFDMANDFTIPLPFLPSSLQTILSERLKILSEKERTKTYVSNIDTPTTSETLEEIQSINQNIEIDEENKIESAIGYLDELADNITNDIDEDTEDGIIKMDSIYDDVDGGILDTNEISNLKNIINVKDTISPQIEEKDYVKDDKDGEKDWLDLTSIIDTAISELNTTDAFEDKYSSSDVEILVNDHSLTKLTPLLNMLDQNIINQLIEGKQINIKLKLGEENSNNDE